MQVPISIEWYYKGWVTTFAPPSDSLGVVAHNSFVLGHHDRVTIVPGVPTKWDLMQTVDDTVSEPYPTLIVEAVKESEGQESEKKEDSEAAWFKEETGLTAAEWIEEHRAGKSPKCPPDVGEEQVLRAASALSGIALDIATEMNIAGKKKDTLPN